MYLKNLNFYNEALLSDKTLIKLTIQVSNKEVTIVPNLYVTYNNIIKNVTKCLKWSKLLPIWQRESCVYFPTVENELNSFSCVNTLYEEIIGHVSIKEKIEIIRKNSHSLMVKINKYLKRYV